MKRFLKSADLASCLYAVIKSLAYYNIFSHIQPLFFQTSPMIEELFTEALRWYNLPWTLMLVLMMLYWLIASVGVVDLDFLDIELDLDADADADLAANSGGGIFAGIVEFTHLGSLPLMVVLSGLVLCAWSFALIANFYLNSGNAGLIGFTISLAMTLPGIVVSSLVLWPVASLYKRLESETDGNLTMVGRTCKVRSDRVDERFGQGEVITPEGPLIVNIRPASESVPLSAGDTALIISEDPEKMLYTVMNITNELTQL